MAKGLRIASYNTSVPKRHGAKWSMVLRGFGAYWTGAP